MEPGAQGAKRIATLLRPRRYICQSCRHTLLSHHRTYASAATAAVIEPDLSPPQSQLTPNEPTFPPKPSPHFTIKAGVVLSRPPILTPDPHPFETAYHLYQRRLNERLVLPFTQYFYFKRGTPAFEHWRTRRRERDGAAARDIGAYNAYSNEGWADEVLMGNKDGEPAVVVRKLIEEEGRAGEFTAEGGDEEMGGLMRRTGADEKGDVRSLERALSRTLYLLVKEKAGDGKRRGKELWGFPSAVVQGREGLKEAARRTLAAACGVNMNTWFVGNHPVGHHKLLKEVAEGKGPSAKEESAPASEAQVFDAGVKTFFMKGRIMAGQADMKENELGVEDFKWLSKEEIEKEVHPQYWASVKNMLVEQ